MAQAPIGRGRVGGRMPGRNATARLAARQFATTAGRGMGAVTDAQFAGRAKVLF